MKIVNERNIVVANRVARILGLLTFLLLLILVVSFGFSVTSPLIFVIGLVFFLIPLLNRLGFPGAGRLILCIFPAICTMVAALLAKIYSDSFTDILYYDARFILILLAIIPCLVYDLSEYGLLYGSLFVIFLCLLMFDPVHEWLGYGYFQRGFLSQSYYYINYVAIIVFLGIVAGALSMRWVIEKAERYNEIAKNEIIEKNSRLTEAYNNLETQNEEISAQTEELVASQEKLIAANNLIEAQKQALEERASIADANLQATNIELISQNNQLREFSYTISHNLRGPIARLMGLTQLPELNNDPSLTESTRTIINYINISAEQLDSVIKDLNKVIDIRNSVHQLRQEVFFQEEWEQIKSLLSIDDHMEKLNFRLDFSSAPCIISVKPLISSILYNLVSNSIKYQSPGRALVVSIRTFVTDEATAIEVVDNGMGIDLELFGKEIFRMYKRFHSHKEGKGLGLYLVKSQVEALNGTIDIKSKPDDGTSVTVLIKNVAISKNRSY